MDNINLLIDATSDSTFLFLVSKNNVVDSFSKKNNKDLSYSLIKYIKQILDKNNLSFHNIKNIYLVCGPGKFSAMRISFVVSQSISFIHNIKLYAINKFDYYAKKDCLCIIPSDASKYFITEYKNNKMKYKPKLIDKKELENIKQSYCGEIVYENNSFNDISKLDKFILVDDNFELEYYKKPC